MAPLSPLAVPGSGIRARRLTGCSGSICPRAPLIDAAHRPVRQAVDGHRDAVWRLRLPYGEVHPPSDCEVAAGFLPLTGHRIHVDLSGNCTLPRPRIRRVRDRRKGISSTQILARPRLRAGFASTPVVVVAVLGHLRGHPHADRQRTLLRACVPAGMGGCPHRQSSGQPLNAAPRSARSQSIANPQSQPVTPIVTTDWGAQHSPERFLSRQKVPARHAEPCAQPRGKRRLQRVDWTGACGARGSARRDCVATSVESRSRSLSIYLLGQAGKRPWLSASNSALPTGISALPTPEPSGRAG